MRDYKYDEYIRQDYYKLIWMKSNKYVDILLNIIDEDDDINDIELYKIIQIYNQYLADIKSSNSSVEQFNTYINIWETCINTIKNNLKLDKVTIKPLLQLDYVNKIYYNKYCC